ncbi:MAG: hypothetical protein ACYDIE_11075 [Candidatus Krumholzibacteriia bacterium]
MAKPEPAVLTAIVIGMSQLTLPVAAPAQIAAQIVGVWEWTGTGCDDGAIVLTPGTEGYTEQTEFGSADTGSLYRRYRNGSLTAEGTYAISQVPPLVGDVMIDVLDVTVGDETTRYAYLRVVEVSGEEAKQLYMSDGLCDYAWTSRGAVGAPGSTWSAVKAQYR